MEIFMGNSMSIKKSLPVFLLSAALCAFFTGCATTKKIQPVLNGMIYDFDNEPVTDVLVHVTDKIRTNSDIYGHFHIENLRADTEYTITCSKEGYETASVKFVYNSISEVAYIRMYSSEQLLGLAENEIQQKKYDAAVSYLDRSEKAGGSKVCTGYLRAVIAYAKKAYDEALSGLQRLMDAGYTEPYIYLFTADVYEYGLSDKENAKKYLQRYLDSSYDPDAAARLEGL
jgi:hypothetical protein